MAGPTALTRKHRKLRSEVEEIASAIRMDVWDIESYTPEARTSFLLAMKDKLVRSEVIVKYTLVDEYLTMIICNYYFRRKPTKEKTYRQLWKTKRFQIFVHYLMDKTFLVPKLEFAHAIDPIPGNVKSAIHRINEVRNAIAHNFFPENLRRYASDKKVMYNGAHLFTASGIEKLHDDCALIDQCLLPRAYGASTASAVLELQETDIKLGSTTP